METTDYCDYKLSLALKAAGFDEPCDHYYARRGIIGDNFRLHGAYTVMKHQNSKYSTASAPTLWQAQKWLREKKGIAINVIAHDGGVYDYDIVFLPNAVDCDCPIDRATFSRTYEEALSEGITSVLELIKKGE